MSRIRDAIVADERASKRMTLSNVLELLLTKSGGEHSSVTLTRNSKGDTQIEVVVRTGDAGAIGTADEAYAKAVELYDRAREQYPPASSATGASS